MSSIFKAQAAQESLRDSLMLQIRLLGTRTEVADNLDFQAVLTELKEVTKAKQAEVVKSSIGNESKKEQRSSSAAASWLRNGRAASISTNQASSNAQEDSSPTPLSFK